MKSKQQLALPDKEKCATIFKIMDEDPLAQPDIPEMRGYKIHDREHDGTISSIRKANYKGHDIHVRTTYEIKIDGDFYRGHLHVDDEGHVHGHSIPYMTYGSTIDFVKCLIDLYPDTYSKETHSKEGGER